MKDNKIWKIQLIIDNLVKKDLQEFFGKFVTYEDRRRKIQVRQRTHNALSIFLKKMRKNVHTMISK